MGPSPHAQVLYIPCAVHGHARDLAELMALSPQGRIYNKIRNTQAQDHAMFGFTPFEIAPTHVGSFIGERSIKGGGGRKE